MKNTWTWVLVALVLAAAAGAQDKTEPVPAPKSATPARANWITPLRVQLVLSKYQGEKKVGSLPYTMTCNADDRQGVQLRLGIEVPIPMTPPKEVAAVTSFAYRNVGTNIDCKASTLEDGRFRVELTVEHSSVYSSLDEKARPAGSASRDGGPGTPAMGDVSANPPLFRTFKSNFNPLLRDGQTVQYTTATDPVSGEVVKIDVTLSVMK